MHAGFCSGTGTFRQARFLPSGVHVQMTGITWGMQLVTPQYIHLAVPPLHHLASSFLHFICLQFITSSVVSTSLPRLSFIPSSAPPYLFPWHSLYYLFFSFTPHHDLASHAAASSASLRCKSIINTCLSSSSHTTLISLLRVL